MTQYFMAVITMQHINKIVNQIQRDFLYEFVNGDDFCWSASKKIIFHSNIESLESLWTLLHEIAHAELGHFDFNKDIELIRQEVSAWEHAAAILAPSYDLTIDDDFIQDHLDSYRLWLHKRSACPNCGQTGLQNQNTYSCVNCRCIWRANDARVCALRRFRLPK